jgi:hypothetical protein
MQARLTLLEGRLRFVERRLAAAAASSSDRLAACQSSGQQRTAQWSAPCLAAGPGSPLLDALLGAPPASPPGGWEQDRGTTPAAEAASPWPGTGGALGGPRPGGGFAEAAPSRPPAPPAQREQHQRPPGAAQPPGEREREGERRAGGAQPGTQALLDRLAARHAEAQALLREMQTRRAARRLA